MTFHLILDDIFEPKSNFGSVIWSFVKRRGNKVALELAHLQPWVFGHRLCDSDFSS